MPKSVNSDLGNWLSSRIEDRKTKKLKEIRADLLLVIEDLAENGPAWTGASAGRPDRAVISIDRIPRHPAPGMTIGNVITGGESGWQINESARRKGQPVTLSITNPMWDAYLKFVEFGLAPHQVHQGHFVRDAWVRHLNRRGR